MTSRYIVSSQGGTRDGKPYAVVDTHDRQGGRGMRRMSFHRTAAQAQAEAKRLNSAAAALPTQSEWNEQR